MDTIALASSSPQRAAILERLGIPFVAVAPECEELMSDRGDPFELATLNANKKLFSVLDALQKRAPRVEMSVLSADTVVSHGGKLFGKPKSRDDAARMLRALSGSSCEIDTAISFFGARTRKASSRASRTEVSFVELGASQIESYLDTGEWRGAAGGFRVQGIAACFIASLRGSCTGAEGLPAHLLYELLLENGCGFIV